MGAGSSLEIFLSYSSDNAVIADEIDSDFKSFGIVFKRDIRDAKYRTSITEFIQQIRKADFVLMIISDEFLKSKECMYGVFELLNTHEFEKRILPIVLDNARPIFKANERSVYYDYWEGKLRAAEQLRRKYPNQDYVDLVKVTTNINNYLSAFLKKITDLNVLSYKKIREEYYRPLLAIIGFDNPRLFEDSISIKIRTGSEEVWESAHEFAENHPGGSENKSLYFLQAKIAVDAKQYLKAKIYYEKALKADSKSAAGHFNFALLLEDHFSDFKAAQYHYGEAIKNDPKYANAYYNLGILLENQFSDDEGAKRSYEQAILADPKFLAARNRLAVLLESFFSDFSGARRQYEEIIKIDPFDAMAHYNLAGLLAECFSDFKNARYHLEEASMINPALADAYNNLAFLLESVFRDYKGARQYYQEALRIDPGNEMAGNNLANLLKKHF